MARFWSWFRLLMGALGLVALITLVDVGQVSDAISEAKLIYLLPAWVLLMASTWVKTYRWLLLLQRNQVAMSVRRLFGTYLIGSFYSQFLPGASAGGDAMRMAETSVDTGRTVNSVSAVMIERGIGLVSIVATASLILILRGDGDIPLEVSLIVHFLSVFGISGLVILRFGLFIDTITRIMTRLSLGKVAEKVKTLSLALKGDLGEPRIIGMMVLLSLLANFFSMSAFYLCLLAVTTEGVNYLSFISLVALIVTLEIIPLTPGSLGVREGAYVFFLGLLGVNEHDALSIGLLIRFITWTQALIGGLVLLERGINRQPQKARQDIQADTSL